jgi:hypothetical protein
MVTGSGQRDGEGNTGEAIQVGIDEKLGWWLAPDGNWYPPELHAGHGASPAGPSTTVLSCIRPMGPRSRFEPLHFGGTCVNCGARINPHEEGWNDPDIDKLMCARCWPAVVASHPSAAGRPPDTAASTRSASPLRSDPRWRSGAVGEYLMAIRLHRDLGDRAVVLSNRRVPHSPAAIDNIVVASSGVWVIDSKKMHGLIEYRDVSGRQGRDRRLLIGGHDRTAMVDRLYDYVIPVAKLVLEPSVPVHGAIAIVEGHWGSPTKLLTRRPYRHEGVWILWPAALIQKIEEPGPLTADEVLTIGAKLDRALPRR